MSPIRIFVGDMPRLLRDIVVEVVRTEPDLSIVGEATGRADMKKLLRDSRANVVVLDAASAADRGGADRLASEHARLKVLVLSDRGRNAEMHWLEPRSARCPDLSPERLVEFIRSALARWGAA